MTYLRHAKLLSEISMTYLRHAKLLWEISVTYLGHATHFPLLSGLFVRSPALEGVFRA